MLEKVNVKNIVNSFYLGLFIGVCIQFYVGADRDLTAVVLSLVFSGLLGLVIGLITEIATAFLPIDIANVKVYFLINNMIALLVASVILLLGRQFFGKGIDSDQYQNMFIIILVIVFIANILEYLSYWYSNKKLEKFKANK